MVGDHKGTVPTYFYAKLKFQTAFSPLTWFPEV